MIVIFVWQGCLMFRRAAGRDGIGIPSLFMSYHASEIIKVMAGQEMCTPAQK